MLNNDFDPYDQIVSLSQSNYELAKALNEQAATIEKLVHTAKRARDDLQHLNVRLAVLEQKIEIG
jgi:Zn-dependent membrane protease YugP